jgi:DNA polymerase-3 subunit alpha
MERSLTTVAAAYGTGPGYGHCSIASNGMWCASWPEREMCEWLIDLGVEFAMHKVLPGGRVCDFYFDGLYWEMDGMDRSPDFFAAKYGELPYVVVTPEDFRFKVERHLATAHVENGDPIVAIEFVGDRMTYDVEMDPDGPLNYIANGIVSHNSHAACYALISYRTAWLKANYPAEYMAALISSVMSTKDKVPFFVARCEELGIAILPPDVNESDHEFVVSQGSIRFGLDAVKGVGFAAVEAIKEARAEQPFTTLWDFCERVDPRAVNKKAIEALVKCGAFDSTGATRKGQLEVLEQAQAAGQKSQLDAEIGQGSIFDLGDMGGGNGAAAAFAAPSHPPIPSEEFEQGELLAHEKDAIGLFLSTHPLKAVLPALRVKADVTLAELPERKDGEWLTVGGIISTARKIKSRAGKLLMFATLDDLEGQIEIMVFENVLAEMEPRVDDIVLIRGQLAKDDKGTIFKAQEIVPFAPSAEEVESAREEYSALPSGPPALTWRVDARALPASAIEDLKHTLGNYRGECEFVLELETSLGSRVLRFGDGFRVAPTPSLRAELERILPPIAASEPAAAATA